MDEIKSADAHSDDKLKPRTPAFATFDSNTDKLLHLLRFKVRGSKHFVEELQRVIEPKVTALCMEIAQPRSSSALPTSQPTEIAQRLSSDVVAPITKFVNASLTFYQWLPVIIVTIVETYLKDVRVFQAQVDPAVMESSHQKVMYAEVLQAQSINDLVKEMQGRWARNFVDDGGPTRWIKSLTNMGARGYEPQTAERMETLWGVRHVIVHSAGVATPDFVRRHADYGAQVGANIVIRLDQVREWIESVYNFVHVTDSYFAQRYAPATELTQINME
jgi:hypothetical protein